MPEAAPHSAAPSHDQLHHDRIDVREEHVTLRPPEDADAATIAALVQESLQDLRPWLPWAVDEFDEVHARDLLYRDLDRQGDRTYNFVIECERVIVGACSLHIRSSSDGEIGYWVATRHGGRGLATIASRLLTAFGFETLSLKRVFVRTDPDNSASQRVAVKLGATFQSPPLWAPEPHSHPDGTSHALIEFMLERDIPPSGV